MFPSSADPLLLKAIATLCAACRLGGIVYFNVFYNVHRPSNGPSEDHGPKWTKEMFYSCNRADTHEHTHRHNATGGYGDEYCTAKWVYGARRVRPSQAGPIMGHVRALITLTVVICIVHRVSHIRASEFVRSQRFYTRQTAATNNDDDKIG